MIDIINSFVVVLRQKDDNSGWLNSADETLEQRYYYCQNWRADVSAIVNGSGMMMAWFYRFRPKVYANNCTPLLFFLPLFFLLLLFLTGCTCDNSGVNLSTDDPTQANEAYSAESWRSVIEQISVGMSRAEFNRAVEQFRENLPPLVKKGMRALPPKHVLTVLATDSSTTVILRVQLVPGMHDCYAVFSDDSLQQFSVDRDGKMWFAFQKARLSVLDGDINTIYTLAQEVSSSAPETVLRKSLIAALDAFIELEVDNKEAEAKYSEPGMLIFLFMFNDKNKIIRGYRRSVSLIKKYDTSDIALGSPPSILREMFGMPREIIEAETGEVRIYGEKAATEGYPIPRVVIFIEDDRIVATFTYYVKGY